MLARYLYFYLSIYQITLSCSYSFIYLLVQSHSDVQYLITVSKICCVSSNLFYI